MKGLPYRVYEGLNEWITRWVIKWEVCISYYMKDCPNDIATWWETQWRTGADMSRRTASMKYSFNDLLNYILTTHIRQRIRETCFVLRKIVQLPGPVDRGHNVILMYMRRSHRLIHNFVKRVRQGCNFISCLVFWLCDIVFLHVFFSA